jgi:hypothetical protein
VKTLLSDAAAAHQSLVSRLPADLQASLPVDAQGVTQAIDYLAGAAGMSQSERRALIRPHAVNPHCSTPVCSGAHRWLGRR